MERRTRHGMAAIALVIALLIIGIIVIAALSVYTGGAGDKKSATSPIERSKSVQCLSQIRRVEMSIQTYRYEHGYFPQSLSELGDMSEKDFCCPVTGSPYEYDANTGTLTCPDHTR
jgi:hypothetical protein